MQPFPTRAVLAHDGLTQAGGAEVVLEQRRKKSREAHDRLAERWVEVGEEFAGGSLRAEVIAQAWPRGQVVADLGCGAGFLSTLLAERGAHVLAVDHATVRAPTAPDRA